MDPEIIAQLEEQLRELTDTISRQTSMMGEQMAAMNKMAGSATNNSKATNSATQTTTKYQEAQQKAYDQQEKNIQSLKKFEAAVGVFSSALGAAAGVLGSMANSLLSSQKGLTKYGEVANQAASGAENLAKSIPIVGDALGALVGTFGKIAAKVITDGLALVDSLTTLRDGLVKTGGSLPVTAGQLADLAKDARYSGENMKVLGKITESLGTGLRSLDATAGRGAVKFMEMANVTDETRRQFGRMGVDQERLTELQALYVKQQQASGNSYDLQTKTAAQLRKESLAYAENMQKLSALTGKQAEQLQSEQEAVAAVVQERMATLKQMADEKRLRDAGDTVAADAIKAEREKRQKFAQELQKMGLTQDEQMKAMQMYRLGAYTDYTKSMAQLNPGLMSLAQGVKNGSISVEKGAEDFGKGLTDGKIRLSNNLDGIADAIDPSVLGDTFGLTSETLKAPLDQLGQSLGESKKAADADTEAAKNRKDEVGDAVENIKSAERELQAKYQDFLMTQIESISKLINQVDIFTEIQEHAATVAKVMAAGMGLVVAANVALAAAAWKAARNLSKISAGMDRLGGDGGPLGDAQGKAKGKGGRGGKLGKLGRFAKGAAIAAALTYGVDAVFGAFGVGKNIDQDALKKQDDKNWDKMSFGNKIESSILRGIEGVGRLFFLDNMANQAEADRVKNETEYLEKKYGKDKEEQPASAAAAADPRAAEIAALRKRVDEAKAAIAAPSAATAVPGAQAVDQAAKDQAKAEEERTKTEKERAKATTESQKYTIKQGDTLSQLAKTFGTTVEALLKANPDIKNKDLIYTGNQLNVPGEQYTVKQGDTLKGIAAALGINLDDLLKANPNIKNKDWKEGFKLNVAGLGGMAVPGVPGVPGVPSVPGMPGQFMSPQQMNEKVLEDQLEKNKRIFREPMQQTEEERKSQAQTFGELSTVMGTFKKNIDYTNDAFVDLMFAADELYEALTGRKRKRNGGGGDGGGGDGGGGGGDTVGEVDPEKVKKATDFFTSKGWTKEQAAGLVGNLITESKLKTDAVGDGGKAYGLAQWHPDRQLEFKKWSGKDIRESTFEEQLEFIDYELRGGKEQKAGKSLAATTTASEAAAVVDKQYERSSGAALGQRQANAERIASGDYGSVSSAVKDFKKELRDKTGGGMTSISAQGKTAQVANETAPHFQKLLDAMTKTGYKIKSLGGYANRNIAGTDDPSAHSLGWAIDVNPDENPDTGKGGRLVTDMPPEIVNYARELGLGWGGAWKNKKDAMHFSAQKNEGGWLQAARGGIFRGPKDGYPMELHGTEMVLPLDTPNMRGNKIADLMSSLTKTGVKEGGIGKISKINDAVMQIVNNETTKAIKAVSEANSPLQNISNEISNSMRKVMEAHNDTMTELTYKLGDMIDALHTSNDVTKKILKKASA